MGLDYFKKKGEAMGKKSMATTMKVNKYENAKMALDLIAHICTADADIDIDRFFVEVDQLCKEMKESDILTDESPYSDNIDIGFIEGNVFLLKNALLSDTSSLKIAVSGGYSAGKSSFLNYITGIGDKLPTGIEPVSIVNTYLNCSNKTKKLIIRGENLKSSLVLLNDEVLECIQHSSKSKVYIASVLKRLLIDIPCDDTLDGITFIDTPGYNNSSSVNAENSHTDEETAVNAFRDAGAIFWCIDIEAGTISNSDLEMIRRAEDKPVVIIFTKMDKKPMDEVKKIVKAAATKCKKELGANHSIIDVIAVSCTEKNIYSYNKLALPLIFSNLREEVRSLNRADSCKSRITMLFDKELSVTRETVSNLEKERKENIKRKSKNQKDFRETKEKVNNNNTTMEDVIITSYDDIVNFCNSCQSLLDEAIYGWNDALNRELEWNDASSIFSSNSASSLLNKNEAAAKKLDRIGNENVKLQYEYYGQEARQAYLDDYMSLNYGRLESIDSERESLENEYQDILQRKAWCEEYSSFLIEYRCKMLGALEEACNASIQEIEKHKSHLQELPEEVKCGIFQAISADNMDAFYSCFSAGVNLEDSNSEGYSPLTWAVKSGNNLMVKFFINNGADLSLKDRRGYNALETAAICHYQDICEMLIEADSSLVSQSAPLAALAEKNKFVSWISQF